MVKYPLGEGSQHLATTSLIGLREEENNLKTNVKNLTNNNRSQSYIEKFKKTQQSKGLHVIPKNVNLFTLLVAVLINNSGCKANDSQKSEINPFIY